jgi:hypothetical protein
MCALVGARVEVVQCTYYLVTMFFQTAHDPVT